MNDSFLTSEVESLIQGYVEGELTASECMRLHALLKAAPGLIAPILANLQADALIRQTVLQRASADLEPLRAIAYGEAAPIQWPQPRRYARMAVRIALAACLMVLAALAGVFFSRHPLQPTVASAILSNETGSVLYEYWTKISGNAVTNLMSHPDFQRAPAGTELLRNFEAPSNRGQDYGPRVRGYLHPRVAGNYRFWIVADDAGELWLSEADHPDNKRRICFLESWASPREWTRHPSQQSQPIRLEAGRRYYIEALHKQGNAGDSLAVAWQPPGAVREIIPGHALSPFSQTNAGATP